MKRWDLLNCWCHWWAACLWSTNISCLCVLCLYVTDKKELGSFKCSTCMCVGMKCSYLLPNQKSEWVSMSICRRLHSYDSSNVCTEYQLSSKESTRLKEEFWMFELAKLMPRVPEKYCNISFFLLLSGKQFGNIAVVKLRFFWWEGMHRRRQLAWDSWTEWTLFLCCS